MRIPDHIEATLKKEIDPRWLPEKILQIVKYKYPGYHAMLTCLPNYKQGIIIKDLDFKLEIQLPEMKFSERKND